MASLAGSTIACTESGCAAVTGLAVVVQGALCALILDADTGAEDHLASAGSQNRNRGKQSLDVRVRVRAHGGLRTAGLTRARTFVHVTGALSTASRKRNAEFATAATGTAGISAHTKCL